MSRSEFNDWFRQNMLAIYTFVSRTLEGQGATHEAAASRVVATLYWYWRGQRRYAKLDPVQPQGYIFAKLKWLIIDELRDVARAPKISTFPVEWLPDSASPLVTTLEREEDYYEHERMKKQCVFLLANTVSAMSILECRAYRLCWESGTSRRRALRQLRVHKADRRTKHHDYDEPLHTAKRRLAEALSPYRRFRDNLSYRWLGQVVYQLVCGQDPNLPCPEDCEICYGRLHPK